MKTTALTLVGFVFSAAAGLTQDQPRIERVSDGVRVTLPADEEDLAGPFLKLAKTWRNSIRKEPSPEDTLRSYVMNPQAAVNLMNKIADFVGLDEPDDAMREDWKAASAKAERAIECWRAWELGFHDLNLWTRTEAEQFRQRDRFVFGGDVTAKQVEGRFELYLRPGFLPARVELDSLPESADVKGSQLDFVLSYRPGSTLGEIAKPFEEAIVDALSNPETYVAADPARDIFAAMEWEVCRKSIARHIVTGDDASPFQDAIALAFCASLAERYDPGNGRSEYFGQLIRSAVEEEWGVSRKDLADRLLFMNVRASEDDGSMERNARRAALAMCFLSLENAGDSLNAWLKQPGKPLDFAAFEERLETAAGENGFEASFKAKCAGIARLLLDSDRAARLAEAATEEPGLSIHERTWPRVVAGRVTVSHPPSLEETVKLAAVKMNEVLTELRNERRPKVRPIEDQHLDVLREYGLAPTEEIASRWETVMNAAMLGQLDSVTARVWQGARIEGVLREGGEIPDARYDPETGEFSADGRLSSTYNINELGEVTKEANSAVIVVAPTSLAFEPTEKQADEITRSFRSLLTGLLEMTDGARNEETWFFFAVHEVAEEALVRDVIRSADRRWFCDGIANWLSMRVCDEVFGDSAGRRIFDQAYPAEPHERVRGEVDLLSWPAAEDAESTPNETAHYYFATLAIEKALEGRNAEWIRDFVAKIKETPFKRANMESVYEAYRKQSGGENLQAIAEQVLEK
ncbi:MAG: hypothetical protein AAF585_10335 [Verrucomicrobiota bacterium]